MHFERSRSGAWFDSVIFVYIQTRPGEDITICHEDRKIGERRGVLLHFEEFRFLRSLGDGAGGRP
jgi:hypothetical protein